jgi:hypothetical protein
MAKLQDEIRVNFTDSEINSLLSERSNGLSSYTRHFNQTEEFFLKLNEEFFVPSFPIHHDVTKTAPTERYLETLKIFLSGVVPLVPQIFSELTYFFDPADTLRPGFFQLYRMGDIHYLYILKLDLSFKTHDHTLIQKGTNDATAEYRSQKLFLEGTIIPLDNVHRLDNKVSSFKIKQTIDQVWIGETGRGYMVQGIWIDHELTKFFTKLFLPPQIRTYPYYPFQCKYKTVCQEIIDFDSQGRRKSAPYLHRALTFVTPLMKVIQDALQTSDFSEDLPAFRALKRRVPPSWNDLWKNLTIKPYLNEQDMKEYLIENMS